MVSAQSLSFKNISACMRVSGLSVKDIWLYFKRINQKRPDKDQQGLKHISEEFFLLFFLLYLQFIPFPS